METGRRHPVQSTWIQGTRIWNVGIQRSLHQTPVGRADYFQRPDRRSARRGHSGRHGSRHVWRPNTPQRRRGRRSRLCRCRCYLLGPRSRPGSRSLVVDFHLGLERFKNEKYFRTTGHTHGLGLRRDQPLQPLNWELEPLLHVDKQSGKGCSSQQRNTDCPGCCCCTQPKLVERSGCICD